MKEKIQNALLSLEKANYVDFFDELDKVQMPNNLANLYNEYKQKFMQGLKSFDFTQQLEVFTKEVNKFLENPKQKNNTFQTEKTEQTTIQNAKTINNFKEKLDNPTFNF